MASEDSLPKPSENCSICGTEMRGTFCYNCGQKVTRKPPGGWDILASLFGGLLTIDRGFLGIMRDLTVQPRKVVENFWVGNRYYYLGPGQLVFYAVFVCGLHIAFVAPGILGFDLSVAGVDKPVQMLLTPQLLFIVFLLPVFALTTYISFLRRKLSFAKHFVSATYIFAYGTIVCTIFFDLLGLLVVLNDSAILFWFLILLFIWASRVLVSQKKWFMYMLMVVVQVLVFFAIQAVLWGSFYLVHPEGLNIKWQ